MKGSVDLIPNSGPRDIYKAQVLPPLSLTYEEGKTFPVEALKTTGLDLTCAESAQKKLKDFHDDLNAHWCFAHLFRLRRGWPKEAEVFIGSHPTGVFTLCGDPVIHQAEYGTLSVSPTQLDAAFDEAQFEQLQCRGQVDPPVADSH
eukprot:Blabericola_migrator_1__5348@NODE_2741_length_2401_cov_18_559983_g1715_i0_p1_GENE_NODE_2741_length_2401_cov_18_559983_g1715_i0NODE_2741_length_2401_cov_18_559983_g1715_i0_p1_ORF_typecomplete_len146_score18_96_NODE_2741_length_2401_cov_18_559983_g1715_i09631400